MPKPEPKPTAPAPKFVRDVIGRRIPIPNPDIPTIGGVPMQIASREYGRYRYEHVKEPDGKA